MRELGIQEKATLASVRVLRKSQEAPMRPLTSELRDLPLRRDERAPVLSTKTRTERPANFAAQSFEDTVKAKTSRGKICVSRSACVEEVELPRRAAVSGKRRTRGRCRRRERRQALQILLRRCRGRGRQSGQEQRLRARALRAGRATTEDRQEEAAPSGQRSLARRCRGGAGETELLGPS